MTEASDYIEGELITHLFRTATFTKPTTIALALLTTGAIDSDTAIFTAGTGVEVTNANAYARLTGASVDAGDANWAADSGSDGITSNLKTLTFAEIITAAWGTVTDMAIVDNATHNTGEMWFYGAMTTSRVTAVGNTLEWAIGAITVTVA
jgi:hypothetical protein